MALIYGKDTGFLIGSLMTVHNDIGPGLDEFIYQDACENGFCSRAIPFRSQVPKWVFHRSAKIKEVIPDFVIDDKIILDLKAVYGKFPSAAFTQIINYCNPLGLSPTLYDYCLLTS